MEEVDSRARHSRIHILWSVIQLCPSVVHELDPLLPIRRQPRLSARIAPLEHRVVDRHSFGNAPLCIGVVNIDFPPGFMLDQRAYGHRVSLRAKIVVEMTTRKPDLEAAHRHCYKCRKEVMASEICGCFHCLATFPPGEIEEWLDDGQTAMCPKCGIDSVIGSASGFSIDEQFLGSMNQRWFSRGGPRANRVH